MSRAAHRSWTLADIPDARQRVPSVWWVPVIAAVALGWTTFAILPGHAQWNVWAGVALSATAYFIVSRKIRSGALRTTTAVDSGMLTGARARLTVCATVAFGAASVWSTFATFFLPASPTLQMSPTVWDGMRRGLGSAFTTSVLEECGIALLILAAAGIVERVRTRTGGSWSVPVVAVLTGTFVRTALHIPLWGWGAIARVGMAFLLAWLFWRTRRIWPLILAHMLWDTVTLQAIVSPAEPLRLICGLIILCWAVAAVIVCAGLLVATWRRRRTNRQSAVAPSLGTTQQI